MNELETAPPDNTPLPPERAKPELNSPKIPITVQPSQRLSSEGNSKPANDAESDSVSQHPAVDSPDGTVRARHTRRNVLLVGTLAAMISLSSLFYCYGRGMTNVYGDGVAHLNIARKVVDCSERSLWRRYIQIGSPWLPLQTFLMLPLVANDHLWRTGLAGSIVSMLCFVITTVAIFLLASDCLAAEARRGTAPGLIAAAVFALNPSVLYMQSTPMSEMVFMAALTVAVLAFRRWAADKTMRRLMAAALAMSVATLSRYEAWPVAMVAVVLVGLMTAGPVTRRIRSATVYGLITAAGPLYWLWHNWAIFGNALEFYNGASSARGIYLQNQANLGWSRIFAGHVALDVCLMLATVAVCAGPLVVLIGGAGLTRLALNWRKHIRVCAPLGLLSLPFGFHVLSVYRGEIQIFPLSALGLLNVRYGLAGLLPLSLLAGLAATSFARRRRWVPGLVVLSVVVAQYGLAVSDGPADLAVYQEGYRNGVNSRQARELSKAAAFLSANHPHDMVLMNTGELGPLVSRGGLTFGEVVHEGTARWYQFQDRIPGDVATVIIRDGDGLDQRFRNNPALARDLASGLALTYQAGGIRVFERAGK